MVYIFIFHNERKYRIRFKSLKRAEAFVQEATQLPESPQVYVASSTAVDPPEDFEPSYPKRGWCPYCADVRHFKYGKAGYRRCEICGMSSSEFHVRRANRLGGRRR